MRWGYGTEAHHLTGDFNGDGRGDIVVLENMGGENYLFLGKANGTFQKIYQPAGIGPIGWDTGTRIGLHLSGDFNGDGRTDILLLQSSGGNNYLFLGKADGTFQKIYQPAGIGPIGWNTGTNQTRHLSGDFNGDGRTDVVVWEEYKGDNYLFLGKADGTFQQIYQPTGLGDMGWGTTSSQETAILTGDFNGDGLSDILKLESLYGKNYLLLGKSDGTFVQIYQPTGIGAMEWNTLNTGYVHLTDDFNGDGKTDILQWDFRGNHNYLILGKSDGTFEQIASPPGIGTEAWVPNLQWGYSGALTHLTGDFNGDGKADILKLESNGIGNDLYIWDYAEPYYEPYCALASIENGQGATTTFSYTPSNAYTNTLLPFIIPTVSSMSVYDGIQTATTAYNYGNGLYDFTEREFWGFGYAKQTKPDNSIQETWFRQDYYLKGKEYQIDVKNPSGTKLSTETLVWETPTVNNSKFAQLTQKYTEFYDSPTVFTQEDYTYSTTHGGVLTAITSGTDGENITTTNTWTNYGTWLWRKSQETITGSSTGKTRETYFGYQTTTGNLLSKQFWLNGGTNPQVTMTYDSYGNQINVTDAKGNTTGTDYDTGTQTYPIKTTYPYTNGVSHIKEFAYDLRFGAPDWEKDENQNLTNYDYDWFGRPKQVDFSDGGQTITEYYDNVSFPQYVITRTKEDTSSTINKYTWFDGLRREIQSIAFGEEGALIVSKKRYDTMGRNYRNDGPFFSAGSVGYPKNPPSAYPYQQTTFDYRSRPTEIKSPDSASTFINTNFAYSGFSTTATDPDSKQKTEKKDYLGRIIQVTEYGNDGNYITSYAYNAAGDLLTVTDTNNKVTTITPDTIGRKISMNDPDMGFWSYTYDANGNLLTQTDAKNQSITFAHDALNRVMSKTYNPASEHNPPVTYTYDQAANGIGKLYSVDNGNVTNTITAYDAMGRILNSSKTIAGAPSTYTVQQTYDLAGKPLNLTYPDAYAIKNTYYPGSGLLYTVEGVSDEKVYAAMTSYQPTGKMGIITYGNAAKTTFAYNNYTTRLQSIVTKSPALTAIQNRAYTYTKAGDISQIIDGIKTITFSYSYDNLHRLTGETHTGSHAYLGGPAILSNNHTDTAHINAVSATTLNGLDYSGNGANFTYTYDLNGNLTEGPDFTDLSAVGSREITYNADNMPVHEINNGATTTDLIYDGEGKRTKKTVDGTTETFYINDQFEVEDGVPVKYVFAGNVRIAQIVGANGGSPSYFHKDHLESSTVTTDEAGVATEQTEYIPFGLMREHAGEEKSNYKYTDQELDKETNLYNYDARMYDPAMGIFTRPDDVTQNWYDPQTLNRYAYCRNNPLIYTDPTGQSFWSNVAYGAFDTAETTWGGLAGQIGVGIIPVVGQIADARDTAAAVKRVWDAPHNTGAWIELGAASIAWVPVAGDAAKGLMKGGEKVAGEVAEKAAEEIGGAASKAVSKRTVVIGENMKNRVIPTAKQEGADLYKPRQTKGDPLKKNERWIDDKMRKGYDIIDIGPDPKRSKRSPFYEAEKKRIEKRNYPIRKKAIDG